MRARWIVATLLVSALGLGVGRAQEAEKEAKVKLPLNPFEKAKTGDWSAGLLTVRGEEAGKPREHAELNVWKVDRQDEDQVVEIKGHGKIAHGRFSTKEAPTIEGFLGLPQKGDVKVEDDKHTVGGKEFACKKVSYKGEEHGDKFEVTLWLSADVKSVGIVAMEASGNEHDSKIAIKFELAGFGSKDKTEWGKSVEDLEKAEGPKDEPATPPEKK